MLATKPKNIAYLFGAGATHAELAHLVPALAEEEKVQRRQGLLMAHVSDRVIEKALLTPGFVRGLEFLQPHTPKGAEPAGGSSASLNIELLISLIENSKVRHWELKARLLKRLVQNDIESILTAWRRSRFYLHKSLFEMHSHSLARRKEKLSGLISLNYDNVLDDAYKEFYPEQNYCLSFQDASVGVPLLKLHGSFDWTKGVRVRGRTKRIDIIPLGSNKNYFHSPYSFIWSRALEVLIACDTLRVIGCSLSQNDTHLVDLLFKAYLERTPESMKAFEIEIISNEQAGEDIRENYRFFPGIRTLTKIEGSLVGDPVAANPFRTWLMAKSDRLLGAEAAKTHYLSRLKR